MGGAPGVALAASKVHTNGIFKRAVTSGKLALGAVRVKGEQTGGGELSTNSTTPVSVERSVGASPEIDPLAPVTNKLTVNVGSNGACAPGSRVDSTRFRVLDFG